MGAEFKRLGFTKMLIDEAHLYPRNADSMLGRFLSESGITHVLGLTATPVKLQTNRDINGESFSKLVMLTSRSKKGNFFQRHHSRWTGSGNGRNGVLVSPEI